MEKIALSFVISELTVLKDYPGERAVLDLGFVVLCRECHLFLTLEHFYLRIFNDSPVCLCHLESHKNRPTSLPLHVGAEPVHCPDGVQSSLSGPDKENPSSQENWHVDL